MGPLGGVAGAVDFSPEANVDFLCVVALIFLEARAAALEMNEMLEAHFVSHQVC